MTAFGIMLLTDMAAVIHIDAEVVEKAVKWLLSRRDTIGGFLNRSGKYFGGLSDGKLKSKIEF